MPRSKKYPEELLERAVQLVFDSGRPIAQVAKDLGVHREALRLWVRQAQADAGTRNDRLTSAERERLKELEREVREVRKANEILKAARACFSPRSSTRPDRSERVRRRAPRGLRGRAHLPHHRDVGVAYYQRAIGERCARDVEDERLLAVIGQTHKANYEAYGSRRMWKALRRQGEDVGRGHVERLMSRNGICGAKRRGKPWRTTIQGDQPGVARDLVQRDFSAVRPDEKWCADFTYIRCWEGVVFFSFVIDVFSRMIAGWQFAAHMRTELVADALEMAAAGAFLCWGPP